METLGEGAFGEVVRAKKKPTCALTLSDEFFALKLVPKECVNKVEEEVLVQAFGHPFLVQLHASFWTVASYSFKHFMTMH
jgi:serine/threonine protein kinase